MAYENDKQSCFTALDVRLGTTVVTHCVLSEVDAHVYGCAPYYDSLGAKDRDPTRHIRAAGWRDFGYQTKSWEQPGQDQTKVELADHFGVILYLATISPSKQHLRKKVYYSIVEAIDETDNVFGLMEEARISILLPVTSHAPPP